MVHMYQWCISNSIIIQMEEITQNWSQSKLRSKEIELINNTDDDIQYDISHLTIDDDNRSIFLFHQLSTIINAHDTSTIRITPNVQANEGKYEQIWEIKLAMNQLSIRIILRCQIKVFSIGIDLPLTNILDDNTTVSTKKQIKTYLLDFGTVLGRLNTHDRRSFLIENRTSVDLRIKLRREGGGVGKFELDTKELDFFLFAYESKTLTINWLISDVVQDSNHYS
ncbi:unnamed protein product [Didymodactylos carnosus]|uniref:Uncharacterized protein n=3 Tax=Didymodactylos carnosus TaxID=1234261 RepID=A0A8S2DZS2_9BILA|nr:unnamed protein product [Didymodactylos carnosus]CAF3778580.1 unnamed protein product [Didymodactylos carnosus]